MFSLSLSRELIMAFYLPWAFHRECAKSASLVFSTHDSIPDCEPNRGACEVDERYCPVETQSVWRFWAKNLWKTPDPVNRAMATTMTTKRRWARRAGESDGWTGFFKIWGGCDSRCNTYDHPRYNKVKRVHLSHARTYCAVNGSP